MSVFVGDNCDEIKVRLGLRLGMLANGKFMTAASEYACRPSAMHAVFQALRAAPVVRNSSRRPCLGEVDQDLASVSYINKKK